MPEQHEGPQLGAMTAGGGVAQPAAGQPAAGQPATGQPPAGQPPAPGSPAIGQTQPPDLASTFVEMLFALAVGQVAVHAADVVACGGTAAQKMPALAHLVVGLLLIATSWLGWRLSAAPGKKWTAATVLSRSFLRLLFDVLLVAIYFIVVRHVELGESSGALVLDPPSSRPESVGLLLIFALYAFWDFWFDVVALPAAALPTVRGSRLRVGLVCMYSSVSCTLLCLLPWRLSQRAETATTVLLLDGALACVVLLFRALKDYEPAVAERLGVPACRSTATPVPPEWLQVLGFLLLVLFGVCVGAAWRL